MTHETQGSQDARDAHAKRDEVAVRYDILDPLFLRVMAQIAHYGAKKYGENNWKLSHLKGNKSPINHIYEHLASYILREPYDHHEIGTAQAIHLVAIAFNAMMEFYHATKEEPCENPAGVGGVVLPDEIPHFNKQYSR